MKRIKLICVAAAILATTVVAFADLSVCASKIRTVENLLQRIGEETSGETVASLEFRPFRQINTDLAKLHVEEARTALHAGLDLECDLQVVSALRALGYLL